MDSRLTRRTVEQDGYRQSREAAVGTFRMFLGFEDGPKSVAEVARFTGATISDRGTASSAMDLTDPGETDRNAISASQTGSRPGGLGKGVRSD